MMKSFRINLPHLQNLQLNITLILHPYSLIAALAVCLHQQVGRERYCSHLSLLGISVSSGSSRTWRIKKKVVWC